MFMHGVTASGTHADTVINMSMACVLAAAGEITFRSSLPVGINTVSCVRFPCAHDMSCVPECATPRFA